MPEQQTFLSMITGSFSTPAAENPTVAMIEAALPTTSFAIWPNASSAAWCSLRRSASIADGRDLLAQVSDNLVEALQ
jgi:hypothetical protein